MQLRKDSNRLLKLMKSCLIVSKATAISSLIHFMACFGVVPSARHVDAWSQRGHSAMLSVEGASIKMDPSWSSPQPILIATFDCSCCACCCVEQLIPNSVLHSTSTWFLNECIYDATSVCKFACHQICTTSNFCVITLFWQFQVYMLIEFPGHDGGHCQYKDTCTWNYFIIIQYTLYKYHMYIFPFRRSFTLKSFLENLTLMFERWLQN